MAFRRQHQISTPRSPLTARTALGRQAPDGICKTGFKQLLFQPGLKSTEMCEEANLAYEYRLSWIERLTLNPSWKTLPQSSKAEILHDQRPDQNQRDGGDLQESGITDLALNLEPWSSSWTDALNPLSPQNCSMASACCRRSFCSRASDPSQPTRPYRNSYDGSFAIAGKPELPTWKS